MTRLANPPVVLLDRDGTINVNVSYLSDPEGLVLAPGAAAGLRRLHELGCRLIVVSNQSGVGRGYFDERAVRRVNEKLEEMVLEIGSRLEACYFCPHAPEAGCACRKPEPGLVWRAAADLGFDPRQAVVIGDQASDVALGRRIGARTVLIGHPPDAGCCDPPPDCVVPGLDAAARWVEGLLARREGSVSRSDGGGV